MLFKLPSYYISIKGEIENCYRIGHEANYHGLFWQMGCREFSIFTYRISFYWDRPWANAKVNSLPLLLNHTKFQYLSGAQELEENYKVKYFWALIAYVVGLYRLWSEEVVMVRKNFPEEAIINLEPDKCVSTEKSKSPKQLAVWWLKDKSFMCSRVSRKLNWAEKKTTVWEKQEVSLGQLLQGLKIILRSLGFILKTIES